MTDEELAAKLSEVTGDSSITSVDAMVEYIKVKIKEKIITRLEDTSDSIFASVYDSLVGEAYNPALTTRQVVAKIAAKAEGDSSVETAVLNDDTAYQEAISKLTGTLVTVDQANGMGARAYVVKVTEVNLEKDEEFEKVYEEHKGQQYQDENQLNTALIADAREYATDEAKSALEDEANLKKEIKDYTGFEFNNIGSYDNTFDLVSDYVKKEFEERTFDQIVADFHYNNIDELLDDAKPYIIEDVISETKTNPTFRREEIERFINADITDPAKKITFTPLATGDADGDNLPDSSLEFISLYSSKVIATLDNTTLMTELNTLGYSIEKLFNDYGKDIVIEAIENPKNADEEALLDEVVSRISSKYDKYLDIPSNIRNDAIEFILDEIGERIDEPQIFEKVVEIASDVLGIGEIDETKLDLPAKDYVIDALMNVFETDTAKREKIITVAIDTVIANSNSDMLDELIDSVIDYLNSDVTVRDEFIDEIIETVYRDTLDRLVKEINKDKQFTVDKDSVFIAEGLKITIEKDYSYAEMIKKLPYSNLLFKVYPESKVKEIYDRSFGELISQIDQAILDAENGQTGYINCGINVKINPILDGYIPLYESLTELASEKLSDKLFYSDNKYLQEIIKELAVDKVLDGSPAMADDEYSGYNLKSFDDYYNIALKFMILADDMVLWYKENLLTEEKLETLVDGYEELALKYANLTNEFLNGDKDGNPGLANAVTNAVKTKFPEYYNKLVAKYEDSPLNKKYESSDYALFRRGVYEAYNEYDAVTDEIFDYKYLDKLFDKAERILVGEDVEYVDYIGTTHTGVDIYEVSIKGIKATFADINDDMYEFKIKDIIITVKRVVTGG